MTNDNVAIVGGGLAGLAAANYLARAGRQVDLYEQSRCPGGRARTFVYNGVFLNLGPHALYQHGPGAAVLRELGIPYTGRNPRAGFLVHLNTLQPLPVGAGGLIRARWLGWRGKWDLARFFATLGTHRPPGGSLAVWLKQFQDPNARKLVAALMCLSTYANHPEHANARAALDQLRLGAKGVLYLDGGWQTLVDGLHKGAVASGVRLRTGTPVEAVLHDDAVRGVRLAGGRVERAGAVLLAIGPAAAEALTGLPFNRGWTPVRAACLDVALKHLPQPDHTFALDIDRSLYYSVHSAAAKLAEPGTSVIHLAKYLGPGDKGSDADRELERLLDLCQPGWRSAVVMRRFLPALTVSNAVVSGPRPAVRVSEVDGLYLAGDWVGNEGMLADASLASAREAAFSILAGSGRRALAKSA